MLSRRLRNFLPQRARPPRIRAGSSVVWQQVDRSRKRPAVLMPGCALASANIRCRTSAPTLTAAAIQAPQDSRQTTLCSASPVIPVHRSCVLVGTSLAALPTATHRLISVDILKSRAVTIMRLEFSPDLSARTSSQGRLFHQPALYPVPVFSGWRRFKFLDALAHH